MPDREINDIRGPSRNLSTDEDGEYEDGEYQREIGDEHHSRSTRKTSVDGDDQDRDHDEMSKKDSDYGRRQRKLDDGISRRDRVSGGGRRDTADAYGVNSEDEKSERKNSGTRSSASIDGDNARVSDGKPSNEQDNGRRQQSDDEKPGRERYGRREKYLDEEEGRRRNSKEEKKGRERLQSSRDADRRDEKPDSSTRSRHYHRHRSDHDDDVDSDEEKSNKTRNKGEEYTGGPLNGASVQDEENDDVDRANGNMRDDFSRKRLSDHEADRGLKDRSSDGGKRRSREESDRGRDRRLDYDRKRHSRDELDRGRRRYEDGDERYEEKRRRYDDDRRHRDSADHKMNQSSGKSEDNYKRSRSSLSHKDSDARVDRRNHEQRRNADTSKNGTVEARDANITVELPKSKASDVSTRKEGVENTEKALGRSGGVYVPPFKLAQMMKDLQDKSSLEYQRMSWDALRKSINGLVNKVNASNIKNIIPELFAENLIRGRGLFCRSCMKSQMASPGFTDVFAALVAVMNTKFPEVGNLLLRRIILQLKRAFKRNDKPLLLAATKFIAHLANQQVAHEIITLELLTVLLENPTDDSVEVAVGFVKECGSMLQDLSPQGLYGIFERFRGILHEGEIDKRVQFLIEGLFAIRKANFQGYPAIRPELDLVEQEDQFTHEFSLEDELDQEVGLDIFKPDPDFLEHEKAYENLKKDILGEESSDEAEGENDSGQESDEDEDEEEEQEEQLRIQDETETNLVNLRRTIYLTIMSSVDFEEAGHKLLKIKLEPGQEMELCIMLLECCSQERTYLRYYGLLGQRFCMINKIYQEFFDKCFVQQYSMIHRLETNKLRNVAKFFAHLLGTDALPWHCLAYIRLTEEDTTSSSRIFIKILFQELAEQLGIRLLNERLNEPTMQDSFESIFPKDNPKNSRFAINFFTSIGLGGITESLREYLKNMPRLIMQQQKPISESDASSSDDDSSSSTGSSDSDSSESESESESQKERKRKRKSTRVSSASESESGSENEDERRRRRKKNRTSSHSESQSESDSDRKKVKRKRR